MKILKEEDLKMVTGGAYEDALAYAREISGKYGIEIDEDLNGFEELLSVCTAAERKKLFKLAVDQ